MLCVVRKIWSGPAVPHSHFSLNSNHYKSGQNNTWLGVSLQKSVVNMEFWNVVNENTPPKICSKSHCKTLLSSGYQYKQCDMYEHVNAALPKNITSRLQLLKKMCQQEINVPVRMAHVKQSNLLSKQGPTRIQLKMRMRMTMVCHLEILKKQYDMILWDECTWSMMLIRKLRSTWMPRTCLICYGISWKKAHMLSSMEHTQLMKMSLSSWNNGHTWLPVRYGS